jgi:hypothetical protein
MLGSGLDSCGVISSIRVVLVSESVNFDIGVDALSCDTLVSIALAGDIPAAPRLVASPLTAPPMAFDNLSKVCPAPRNTDVACCAKDVFCTNASGSKPVAIGYPVIVVIVYL